MHALPAIHKSTLSDGNETNELIPVFIETMAQKLSTTWMSILWFDSEEQIDKNVWETYIFNNTNITGVVTSKLLYSV